MSVSPSPRAAATLSGLVALAAGVRWPLFSAPLYLDEAYSGLAARGILNTGLPLFSTGLYYDRDLVYHYALAGALKLGGGEAAAGRALSLAAGLALIPSVWALVRRMGGAERWALLAAALVAIDPFTASMTPRMRMYPFLQLAGVWLLHAYWAEVVDPRPGLRWRGARVAAAAAFGLASHQLAVFFAPALGVHWLLRAWRAREVPWRAWALVILGAAAPLALSWAVGQGASSHPDYRGVVVWGGEGYTAEVYEHIERLPYLEILAVKWQTSAPVRAPAIARALLWLLALGAASLALWRRGPHGSLLVAYAWAPLALLALYPWHELPTRWLVHLAPLFLVVLAGGVEAFARARGDEPTPALPSPGVLAAIFVLAALAALAVAVPHTAAWPARYPLQVAAAVTGAAAAWWWRARAPGRARWTLGAALAAVLTVNLHMPLALWWSGGGHWAEVAGALAEHIGPDDAVLVLGEDAPTVAWSLPRVHAVVACWRLEYARATAERGPVELASGAAVLRGVQDLEALAARHPTVWVLRDAAPPRPQDADQRFDAKHGAPVRAWLDARAERVAAPPRGPQVWRLTDGRGR